MFQTGPENSLTDVRGLLVGHADDPRLKSGVTTILCEQPAVASVFIMGGAPGTRETDLLAPENRVEKVDAIVLSGGSAFGLAAASGVADALRLEGRGFAVGGYHVPIVPAAILFDLLNGGDKNWGHENPYVSLGQRSLATTARSVSIGSVGAGAGALVAGLKGGLGTASTRFGDVTVAALVAVNALGSPMMGDTPHFWAHPFELGGEFGGLGGPKTPIAPGLPLKSPGAATSANTTLGVIATDATLTKAECKRLAIAAHDGFAKALWPSHTPMDGDIVFALSTGREPAPGIVDQIGLNAMAASTMARAIARGVHAATARPSDRFPTWTQEFGA